MCASVEFMGSDNSLLDTILKLCFKAFWGLFSEKVMSPWGKGEVSSDDTFNKQYCVMTVFVNRPKKLLTRFENLNFKVLSKRIFNFLKTTLILSLSIIKKKMLPSSGYVRNSGEFD